MKKYWEHTAQRKPLPQQKQWTSDALAKQYHTSTWRRLRKVFLVNNPICVMCETIGKFTPANVVDHIVPIRKGGEFLEWENLQSLCASCHNSKTMKERHEHS
jgi:5-methylcytosine-specific restriction protein A